MTFLISFESELPYQRSCGILQCSGLPSLAFFDSQETGPPKYRLYIGGAELRVPPEGVSNISPHLMGPKE